MTGKKGGGAHLERGEHLALLLPVEQTVVILHGEEWREVVGDRVVCTRVRKDNELNEVGFS